jgi:hypothetical protein
MQRDRYVVMANHLRGIIIREGGYLWHKSRTAPTNNILSIEQMPIFLTGVVVLYKVIQNTEYRIQDTEYRIQDTESGYRIQNQDTGYRRQETV